MMGTKVVSFREDEEALRFIREQGLNPSEVAKEAFEAYIKRLQRRQALDWIREHQIEGPGDAAQEIRELRDTR